MKRRSLLPGLALFLLLAFSLATGARAGEPWPQEGEASSLVRPLEASTDAAQQHETRQACRPRGSGQPGRTGHDSKPPVASSTWAIERLGLSKSFSEMGDHSLALDGDGHPHIAYGSSHLYYARYDGTTWHIEQVDPAWGVGLYAALDLDPAGRAHISYFDDANGNLKYAYYDGAAWQIQTLGHVGWG